MHIAVIAPEESHDGDTFEVWLEIDEGSAWGFCAGAGETKEAALRDCQEELKRAAHEVEERIRRCHQP